MEQNEIETENNALMSRKEFNTIVGKAMADKRKSHGWTLDNVVELTGDLFSRSSLSQIENGNQEINIYQFFVLEKILGQIPRPKLMVTISSQYGTKE